MAHIITIDRTKPVDPRIIPMTHGKMVYTIARQDPLSLAITQLDPETIILTHALKRGEKEIRGTQRPDRLADMSLVPLDFAFLAMFLADQRIVPRSWRRKRRRCTPTIFFEGTAVVDQNGQEYTLGMMLDYIEPYSWKLVVSPTSFSRLFCDLSATVKKTQALKPLKM